MKIEQLQYLDTVVSCGSISKAAEKCYLSTSTLARQISCMEEELGFPVFEKNPSGVKLTDQGALFYNQTKRIIPIYDNALRNAKKLSSTSITIRVGIANVLNHIIGEVCRYIESELPDVNIEFVSCPSLGLVEDYLLENRIDAFVLSDVDNLDERYYCVPFFSAYNSVMVSVQSPFAANDELRLNDLNGHALLISSSENKHIITLRRALKRQCPDAELILFDDPEVAHVEAIKNNCFISSISMFSPSYGLKNIKLTDAPGIKMGFCCLKGNEGRYSAVIDACRAFFTTYDTNGNAEDIPI